MSNDFTFVTTIPSTGADPSAQYLTMQANNVSDADIWEVDHGGYNTSDGSGGSHVQLTFLSNNTPGSSPSGEQSIVYTAAGTASSSSNLFIKNPSGTFLMSAIKAFGSISYANPSATLVSGYNISSVSFSSPNITVNLTSSATTGSNVILLVTKRSSTEGASDIGYSFAANVVTITPPVNNTTYDFILLQV